MQNDKGEIAAVVLAAGMSRRMGTPKMALPWDGSTVLGTVLHTIHDAGIADITVVIGSSREVVEAIANGMPFAVNKCYNENYANGEMLESIKVGLASQQPGIDAVLIALGDQPQVEARVIAELIHQYRNLDSQLIVPSFDMRRGHPWLISRKYWDVILAMHAGQTMRDYFTQHAGEIKYLVVDTPSVLQDLDTPEDYKRAVKK